MNNELLEKVYTMSIEELIELKKGFILAWYVQKNEYQLKMIDIISDRIDELQDKEIKRGR